MYGGSFTVDVVSSLKSVDLVWNLGARFFNTKQLSNIFFPKHASGMKGF